MVAFLNVQLPLTLGQLINVVSSLQPGKEVQQYIGELVQPGLKLAGY